MRDERCLVVKEKQKNKDWSMTEKEAKNNNECRAATSELARAEGRGQWAVEGMRLWSLS